MKFFDENIPALAGWSGALEPAAGKGFILLVLVFIVLAGWRRGTAAARHLTWTVTFLCLLCLPIFVHCLPAWPAPAWMVPPVLSQDLPDSLTFNLPGEASRKAESAAVVSENKTVAQGSASSGQTAQGEHPVGWRDIAMIIWFAGAMFGLARLLLIQIRLECMAARMQTCQKIGRAHV